MKLINNALMCVLTILPPVSCYELRSASRVLRLASCVLRPASASCVRPASCVLGYGDARHGTSTC